MLFAHQHHAVALKHVGYLAATVMLDPTLEVVLLICSTALQDLGRAGVVEPCMALAAVPSIGSSATLPALEPTIASLLSHAHPLVRRRAALARRAWFHCRHWHRPHGQSRQFCAGG